MRIKKKILCVVLCATMLAGCAKTPANPETTAPVETTESAAVTAESTEATQPVETTEATTQETTTQKATQEETTTAEEPKEKLGENILRNPNFAKETDDWNAGTGSSSISIATSDTAIFDEVYTYGVISRDPATSAPYDCFAQDITKYIEVGTQYKFEFYARLSDEYADAPATQRVVEFAPFYTLDGETAYLGSYSSEIKGDSSLTITNTEWTKYEGTFTLDTYKQPEVVVIRIIEQGTNYGQGDCVKGDYYITGVSLRPVDMGQVGIEKGLPNMKDSVASEEGLGTDAIMGCGVTYNELTDKYLQQLVTKHFNAVTFGNELKPDCLFGYSNSRCPGTEEVEFNGQTLVVPKMTFKTAEKMLDILYKWNQENPDDQIKVRGHVLVWHAQTPEWFFHVDYDPSKDYVTKEEMDVRLEWYIKTVLTHFTGEDSKYKGMFYGWDVVNEAISDGTGTYRTDMDGSGSLSDSTHGSKSSWWHVYQSNEYIINAFKYANKYAPADVDLYYNDYGECSVNKMKGILALLQAVKDEEGEPGVGTRISGMGMQGHYNSNSPMPTDVQYAVKKYCEVVGKVMLTELDMKCSSTYDGTEKTRVKEFIRMGNQYKTLYNTLKELDKEEGIDVCGITFWGVVDKYSWLQSSSNVGGGNTKVKKECPLPFDDNYKAKPAFWAFVDPSKIADYQ